MRGSLAVIVACCLVPLASPAVTAPPPVAQDRPWLGPDADPLPFVDHEEVVQFLKTAEILSTEKIPVGVTRPRKAILEKHGIRAQATLKTIDETHEWVRLSDGSHAVELRDYYMFEYAAYELSRLLGLDSVPPTVIRRDHVEPVSLQLWIENGMTEAERRERSLHPPNARGWLRQVQTMYLFDDLIANVDRNVGDIVIDSDWKLWMIDHSRAFQARFEPRHLEQILFCRRDLWKSLRELDERQVREGLGNALTGLQIDALLARRDILARHMASLIDKRGEGAVLYDPQAPSPGSRIPLSR